MRAWELIVLAVTLALLAWLAWRDLAAQDHCANCGRRVRPSWNRCPFCRAALR